MRPPIHPASRPRPARCGSGFSFAVRLLVPITASPLVHNPCCSTFAVSPSPHDPKRKPHNTTPKTILTTAIIAEYLADAASAAGHTGVIQGIKTIEPPRTLIQALRDAGCYDADRDEFSARKVYDLLCEYNSKALEARYGNGEDADPFASQPIDKREETRREWLSNLFTVARCYRYQCDEGDVGKSDFLKAFEQWVDEMAYTLAAFTVDAVRPKLFGDGWKSWSEF